MYYTYLISWRRKNGNDQEIYFWTTTIFIQKLPHQICEGWAGLTDGSSGTAWNWNQFISADAWNEIKVLFPACVFVFSSSCSTFLDVLFFFHEFSQKAHKCHFFVTLVKGIKGDVGGGVITCADGIKAGYKDSLLGIGYCWVQPRFTAQYM